MLKVLDYTVEFPTTGRTFANRIEFAPGLTAITGRNEAGKTIVFEMIGYCLFGKSALRGQASDYRNLVASLELTILDNEVRIERARKEQMFVNGELMAVGADAINREVPRMLGFGLEVFNIASAAQQGNLGALTEMRPTARRAMIDQLVGLDRLEAVERECKNEARVNATTATALAADLVEPVEPVKPDDYADPEELSALISQIEQDERERTILLQVTKPEAPVQPEQPDEYCDVETLEQHEAERQRVMQQKARLEGELAAIPIPRYTKEELDRAIAYQAYQAEVARLGPKPEYTTSQLDHWHEVLLAKSCAGDLTQCPNCNHKFHLGLDPDQERLLDENVPITPAELTRDRQRHFLWATPPSPVEPFEIDNIEQEKLAHARTDDRIRLGRALAELTEPADRSGDLRAARSYQQALILFEERQTRYLAELHRFDSAQARLREIPERSGELVALRDRRARSLDYQARRAEFESVQADFDARLRIVREHRERAAGYDHGSTALSRARVRIKSELAPSLSNAASILIRSFTGGERNSVEVDGDFNITVDGQPLATLSGSGKSVANLALRIGLGQVLTSKVLPIFLGDEIDAAMDSSRAGTTHQTLRALTQYLKQILIVTHKQDFEADHQIAL